MKLHAAIVFLGVLQTCTVETDGEPRLGHHLTKRQIPRSAWNSRTSHHRAQGDSAGTVTYVGSSSSSDRAATRDYQGSYPSYGGQNQPVEDLIASAHLRGSSQSGQAGAEQSASRSNFSSSVGGGSTGRSYYRSTSRANATSSGEGGGSRGRSYYRYQPPISTGERIPSHTRRTGTRYSYSRPVDSSIRASQGNTYIYPFSGGRERLRGTGVDRRYRPQGSSRVPTGSTSRSSFGSSSSGYTSGSSFRSSSGSASGSSSRLPSGSTSGSSSRLPSGSTSGSSSRLPSGSTSGSSSRLPSGSTSGSSSSGYTSGSSFRSSSGSISGSSSGYHSGSSSSGSYPGTTHSSSASVLTSGGHTAGESVSGHEEPVVQVLPSQRPVLNARQQHQELLRQRRLERQRLMQQRQQQRQQGGYVPTGQHRGSGTVYTGGITQTATGTDQQPHYTSGQHQQPRPGFTGSQPVYSSGRQQVPYGSHGFQTPYYGYNQGGFDFTGYDSECPDTGIRIQINGIPCDQAVDHYGTYLCYRHEYTSRECCLKCRGLKNPAKVGCEYGDHSGRCQQLQSFDCYDLRNRQGCCQSCERMQVPGARPGCEYGDMTPNCERVRQNPGLCYIPENRYLCCQTCSTIRVTDDPECPWGDQNDELCQPFDQNGNIRINCYAPPIKRICCQACQRLKEWIRSAEPGCEYGDRPVTFNTGTHRALNCTTFMRYFGYDQCTQNQAVGTNCCYTCHRYTSG